MNLFDIETCDMDEVHTDLYLPCCGPFGQNPILKLVTSYPIIAQPIRAVSNRPYEVIHPVNAAVVVNAF